MEKAGADGNYAATTQGTLVELYERGARCALHARWERRCISFLDGLKRWLAISATWRCTSSLTSSRGSGVSCCRSSGQNGADVVLDHIARATADQDAEVENIYAFYAGLDGGMTWIKLSQCRGTHESSLSGHHAIGRKDCRPCAGTVRLRDRLAAPQLDRSHDGELVDLIADWAPDPRCGSAILVDNPAILHGFS
jgi:hypothetical protein